ncbi:MAG: hypothetical protein ACJA2W_001505 [Planctomycetota bacterium]
MTQEAARAQVVDRLLSASTFGERMATPWLDVARYADSYGYQSDQLAPHWPYRDWVVEAFNTGLSYDDFLVHQLAGDVLAPGSDDARDLQLATAFNRLHRMTNEGGSVEEEWRHAYAVDRVETFGTAVLGLTLGCARCHDHKFDPITQSEFYSFVGFFHSIDEWGTYHDSSRVPTPSLLLPTAEEEARIAGLNEQIAAIDSAINEGLAKGEGRQISQWKQPGEPVFHRTFDELGREGKLAAVAPNLRVEGRSGDALQLSGDDGYALSSDVLTDFGPAATFALGCWLRIPSDLEDAVILHRSGGTDVGYYGFDIVLMDGALVARQIRFWPGNAAAVIAHSVPRDTWFQLHYAQGGTGRATEMQLFVNGRSAGETLRDGLTKLPGVGPGPLTIGARFRDAGFRGGAIDEIEFFAGSPHVGAAPMAERVELMQRQRRDLCAERLRLQTGIQEISVMRELPVVRSAYTLYRGQYDSPKTPEVLATRRFPAVFRSDGDEGEQQRPGAALDRLDLARWLTEPDHPLTARVAVNRFWQVFFGQGLMATAGDFGLQGAQPTHPDLLDWLARDFVASKWDVKALCRKIVLSATYGQDSATTAEARSNDPENEHLARGPSGRLSAEMLRDAALLASGQLDRTMGGPPVSPFQPEGLWRTSNSMSPAYQQSVGRDLYRRSLYSVVKRTAPLPNMVTFDLPLREASCARRETTSTPLQGLVLLNDIQFVEAAGALAARAVQESGGGARESIAWMFRALAGRTPTEFEVEVLADLLSAEESLPLVAQAILSLDAVVWKR